MRTLNNMAKGRLEFMGHMFGASSLLGAAAPVEKIPYNPAILQGLPVAPRGGV